MTFPASFRLDGRTALVCGAARGLGWEIALLLARAGAHVVLNGRSPERLAPRLDYLAEEGLPADQAIFDLADRPAMNAAIAALGAHGLEIDVLVNAVGERDRRPASLITPDEFARLIDVDLTASFALVKCVVDGMARRRWGRIVMLTSIVDTHAVPNAVSYVAAKGGLSAMTRALGAEYGRHGVTCNALAPGFFATETNEALAASEQGRTMAMRVPLGRWAEPREIAGAALFLCSPAASYVNGHTLIVDGGVTSTYAMPREAAK